MFVDKDLIFKSLRNEGGQPTSNEAVTETAYVTPGVGVELYAVSSLTRSLLVEVGKYKINQSQYSVFSALSIHA
jgi:hypothetical protein